MSASGYWTLAHRGDPCVLCQKPASEVAPGGCPVDLKELWSRIGQITDAANAAWEDEGRQVEARTLEEERKRLTRLHEVLSAEMVAIPRSLPLLRLDDARPGDRIVFPAEGEGR